MKKKKIVILESNVELRDRLIQAFEAGGYDVRGVSDDGAEGIDLIGQLHPDLIVTELFLKSVDGIGVLEAAKAANVPCVTIVAAADDALIGRAMEKGAKYCLVKPFAADTAVKRVDELLRAESGAQAEPYREPAYARRAATLEERISNIFISIGIPPHIKGYSYLREGIKMAVERPDVINNVTKILYPKIGEKYGTTASKVERAIRHAIEVAWNRGRIDVINAIFGARVYIGNEKPTNSEFIALVADKLILETMV